MNSAPPADPSAPARRWRGYAPVEPRGARLAALCAGWCAIALWAVPAAAQPTAPEQAEPQNFWQRIYDPDHDAYLAALSDAGAAWLRGDPARLRPCVERLVELRPEGAGTLYFRALLLSRDGDHEEASTLLEAIVAGGPSPEEVSITAVWADLALARTRLGRYVEALSAWGSALEAARLGGELGPEDRAIFLSNMAELELARGEAGRAVELYRESLSLAPTYVHGLFGMGAALERLGRHEEARSWVLAGIVEDPVQARAFGPGVFFVPQGEEAFRRGQVQEELGRYADASRSYREALDAASDEGPAAEASRLALARVEAASPVVVGRGAAPLRSPTAVAADPAGRYVAFGDALGRVVMMQLAGDKVLLPSASGPAVDALTFDAAGRLLVAREDGFVRTIEPDGRQGRLIGPVAVPSGTQTRLISSDGAGLLVSSGRQRLWGLVALERPEVELGQLQGRFLPFLMAMGPLNVRRKSATIAMWSGQTGVVIEEVPSRGVEPVQAMPLAGDGVAAMALSRDGRWLVSVGTRFVTLSRTSDLRVVKVLSLADDGPRPSLLVIDEAGGGGLGPAVIVVYPDSYVALRLSALGPFEAER